MAPTGLLQRRPRGIPRLHLRVAGEASDPVVEIVGNDHQHVPGAAEDANALNATIKASEKRMSFFMLCG